MSDWPQHSSATWASVEPAEPIDWHACDEPGCDQTAHACILPGEQEADGWYCPDHAFAHGFCKGCGEFWGGVEAFEFTYAGWCENCRAEFDDDLDVDDEEDVLPGDVP